jgi:hypothetical protein
VERGWVWCVTAGQARFVGVWCGAARIGSLRQVRYGSVRKVAVGHSLVRRGSAGQARTGKVCCGLVRPGWVRQGRQGGER